MAGKHEFWTAERIGRLERSLSRNPDDIFAATFLARLGQCKSLDKKRQLIVEELIPALRYDTAIQVWEGREIQTRVPLRDIVQDFLHSEGVIVNRPTNEPDTTEEAAERERLARLFGRGKAASEIVIEDRGPR